MSQRNQYIRDIENKYMLGPLCGSFKGCEFNKTYNSIDINKAYTSNLKNIEYFPVFNSFDIFLNYDNHNIEDYTQYIIECLDDNTQETSILFRSKFSRCYGFKLNRIQSIKYKILYYRRPSKLIKSNSNKYISDLYNSTLSKDEKKFIINKNLGLIEKKKNERAITKVFYKRQEAEYYQIKYGGYIYTVQEEKTHTEEELTQEEIDEGIILKTSYNSARTVYLLVNTIKKIQKNLFDPIKDLIYDIQLLELWKLYKKAIENNIKVFGIKTDCLLVEENKDILKNIFNLNDEIGGLKIEQFKTPINKKNYDD